MFYFEKNCYSKILSYFSDVSFEKCGLIGASDSLNIVSDFSPLNSVFFNNVSCVPDSSEINRTILNWTDAGICFCGIIHSHTGECKFLSKEDKAYAEIQLSAYAHMPFLFFPIVLEERKKLKLFLYVCSLKNGVFNAKEVEYRII